MTKILNVIIDEVWKNDKITPKAILVVFEKTKNSVGRHERESEIRFNYMVTS